MSSYVTWTNTAGQVKFLRFDIVESQTVVDEQEVSDHPIEDGADVSDNVRPKNIEIQLDVFIGNSVLVPHPGTGNREDQYRPDPSEPPLGERQSFDLTFPQKDPGNFPVPSVSAGVNTIKGFVSQLVDGVHNYKANVFVRTDNSNRVRETVFILDQLKADAQIVKVVTNEKTYDSMMVTKVERNRTANEGNGAMFRLSFREVNIVSTKIVNAPKPTVPRAAPVVKKGSTPGVDPKPQELESIPHQFLKNVFGVGS